MKLDLANRPNPRPMTGAQLNARRNRMARSMPSVSYDARRSIIASYCDHLHDHDHLIQYAVTLQTNLIPAETPRQLEWQFGVLKENFRHFCNRLNQDVYGNGHKRKPDQFSLLILPVIQGALFSPYGARTLHYHLALGNVPAELDFKTLSTLIRRNWKTVRVARDDTDTRPADPGWQTYITREVEQGHIASIDYDNWHVPHEVLSL